MQEKISRIDIIFAKIISLILEGKTDEAKEIVNNKNGKPKKEKQQTNQKSAESVEKFHISRIERLCTNKNIKLLTDTIKKVNDLILIEFDLDGAKKLWKKMHNEIYYDEIRNGQVISSKDILEFISYYRNELAKVKYLSFLLNKYYKPAVKTEMNNAIDVEDYELAAILRDTSLVTEMPSVKE